MPSLKFSVSTPVTNFMVGTCQMCLRFTHSIQMDFYFVCKYKNSTATPLKWNTLGCLCYLTLKYWQLNILIFLFSSRDAARDTAAGHFNISNIKCGFPVVYLRKTLISVFV